MSIKYSQKSPVVQEDRYGCGVACVAYILGIKYEEARKLFISERIIGAKTYCFDITRALAERDLIYRYKKVKENNLHLLDIDGIIAFVRKNKSVYPMGHYLAKCGDQWMDPWINRQETDDVLRAMSGFSDNLRDSVTWIIYPK